jgi:sec-independent protein translocase protein TatA
MAGNVLTPTHLLILLAVALIVLGPKRLPAAGRGLGEAMRGFKDALTSSDHSDATGPQISESGRIMQASDVAGAGTTSQATPDPTSSSSNDAPRSEATTEDAGSQSSSTEGSSNLLQQRS